MPLILPPTVDLDVRRQLDFATYEAGLFAMAVARGLARSFPLKRAVLDARPQHPEGEKHFVIKFDAGHETFLLKDELLFPKRNPLSHMSLFNDSTGSCSTSGRIQLLTFCAPSPAVFRKKRVIGAAEVCSKQI